jgi:hypothetical protein
LLDRVMSAIPTFRSVLAPAPQPRRSSWAATERQRQALTQCILADVGMKRGRGRLPISSTCTRRLDGEWRSWRQALER